MWVIEVMKSLNFVSLFSVENEIFKCYIKSSESVTHLFIIIKYLWFDGIK